MTDDGDNDDGGAGCEGFMPGTNSLVLSDLWDNVHFHRSSCVSRNWFWDDFVTFGRSIDMLSFWIITNIGIEFAKVCQFVAECSLI